jgi:hypothetical protein
MVRPGVRKVRIALFISLSGHQGAWSSRRKGFFGTFYRAVTKDDPVESP